MKLTVICLAALFLLKVSSSFPTEKQEIQNSLDLSRYGSEIYNSHDEAAGKMLTKWLELKGRGNAEEQGTYFEGDIVIDARGRNGVIAIAEKWNNGKIPYEVRGSFTQKQKNLLSDAIEEFKKHTCIEFMPRGGEDDYVIFDNEPTGCWSSVGRIGGEQTINFQTPGCMSKVGSVIHEILHAVGFFHEQSRFDRDNFVKINYKNIPRDKYVNFEKISEDEISSYGVAYDYESVLHYSPYAFSMNGKATIEALRDTKQSDKMGQREGFSKGDIMKVNAMYCIAHDMKTNK